MDFKATHILMLMLLLASSLFCMDLHASPVSRIDISGLNTISEAVVRDVIPIKQGDEFSFKAVDDALSYLRKWGVFDVIEANPSMTPDGVIIDFRLEEAIVVESVDIDGNYPYIENKIIKYLNLHPGDLYTPDRVDEQVERIKAFYKRQGFVGTDVYSSVKAVPEVNGAAITLHIRRGDVLRYRNIEINGNKEYPSGRFVSKINPLKPYSERRLKDAIRDLREFYQKNGYPRARIKLVQKDIDFQSRRVDITIDVYEGPRVKLKFAGGPHMNRKILRKTVTILEEGSVDDFEIEMSSDELEKLLRHKGYPDAKVEGKKKVLGDGTILITFNIEEGKPQRIKFLKFDGASDVKEKKLAEKMQNRSMSFKRSGAYYPEYIDSDDENLEIVMRKHGYLDAKVQEWKTKPAKNGYSLEVTVPIVSGPQTLVGGITFNGDTAFAEKKLLREIKAGLDKPFDEPGIAEDRERLITFFADNGYPYAIVEADWKLDEETGLAWIDFNIDSGPLVRIGQILIVGDVLTSQKAIKRAMAIKEGDPFSYRKVIESQLNIRRLGPFSSVNVSTVGLEDKMSFVHLKVKVEEQKPFLVDLGLNYSTDEALTGSLTFTNLNAFGWAKTNALELTAGRKLTRAELVWHDPRFFASSFEMNVNGWFQYKERPSYSYFQAAGAVGWFRRYRRLGFLFRWEMDRNYFVQGDSVAADADSLRNNTISNLALSSSLDTRDSFSDPRKGFFTFGGVNIYNEVAGDNADFFKFTWEGEGNLSPFNFATFTTSLRFSRILTIGKNVSVPTNELLFLGGNDTIRGFSEDSLGPTNAAGRATGARLRWIANEELRLRVFRRIELAGFFDMGSLTESFSAISWNTIRRSVGAGLRYITPVGPLRLDYGFKLDRKTGESRGRLHFTFGYVF